MKLWEIKAQALRLMFADTDIQFSESEFSSGSIYNNANTRDKLVRMEDSIKRAIDVFYSYRGEEQRFSLCSLKDTAGVKSNEIVVFPADFGFPTRVDVFIYHVVNGVSVPVSFTNSVNFVYDAISKSITFLESDYTVYYTDYTDYSVSFRVFYHISKLNLPASLNEITYDLDTLFIPAEVQRKIPLYVKGELYEEDEASLALNAKNEYIAFCAGLRKPAIINQTKVKRSPVFNK